jgi:hypothetical protein
MVGGLYTFKGHPRLRYLIIVDSTIKRNIIGTYFNKLGKMSMMRAPTEHSGARLVGFRQQPTASSLVGSPVLALSTRQFEIANKS